jgi:hypothetical protein
MASEVPNRGTRDVLPETPQTPNVKKAFVTLEVAARLSAGSRKSKNVPKRNGLIGEQNAQF